MRNLASIASRRNRQRQAAAIIALTVAGVAFLVITAGGIGENLIYYWTPRELHQAGDKAFGATIRLGGMVKAGTIVKSGSSSLEFDVTDRDSFVHVKSRGVPPQLFREGIGVVVEGTMTRSGYFESERLLVSHGNEYRPPKDHPVDTKELMRTTKGLEP